MPLNEIGDLPLDVKDILLDRDLRKLGPRAFRGFFYLIFEQWLHGPLPPSMRVLAALSGCTATVFKRHVWPQIEEYFEITVIKGEKRLIEPLTYHKRMPKKQQRI